MRETGSSASRNLLPQSLHSGQWGEKAERLLRVDSGPIGLPNHPQIFINGSTSQRRPPPPLARSHHDGITRQNATLTPTVTLRPIKGAAFLMNEVWA